MGKDRKYYRLNGQQEITGVSHHDRQGFYIRVPHPTTGESVKLCFGKGEAALWRAKAEWERRNGLIPQYAPAKTVDEAREELERVNIDPDLHPELVHDLTANDLNPEWASKNPQQFTDHVATKLLGVDPAKWAVRNDKPPMINPSGREITVSRVGQLYLDWYVTDRGHDIGALKQRVAAMLPTLQEQLKQLQEPSTRRKEESKKRNAKILAVKRRIKDLGWVDMLPRTHRRTYEAQERYFGEFVDFIKNRHRCDLPIGHLTGNDLRAYCDHVMQASKKNKRTAKGETEKARQNQAKWRNSRYQAVTTAFRRVKKQYPDAQYPQGFFGVDGTISILECRDTVSEAPKITLTPAEFKALVDVADTQWKAIFYLSMNCALENESVSQIPWTAIDFDRRIMFFARPKNNRIRQTPLADATIDALKKWRDESPSTHRNVFVTPHGGEWLNGTDSLGKHLNDLKTAVKERTGATIGATFKAFRKSASTVVMAATHDEKAVDFLLGQAPNKSWRHYVGLAPDFLREGIRVIEETYFK